MMKLDDKTMTTGVAATLRDAVELANTCGPGTRLSVGIEHMLGVQVLAPGGLVLSRAEATAAVRSGARQYLFTFGSQHIEQLAGIAAPLIETLCTATGTGFMAACVAEPLAGRTVYQGQLFEGGKRLGDLLREFSLAMDGGVGLVAHDIVTAGALAIRRQCGALKEQGKALAFIDAINQQDCAAIAEALAAQPLIGGSAWLARKSEAGAAAFPAGPIAILSGALDRQTLFQIGAARATMPVFDLDFTDPDPVEAALTWAAACKPGGNVIITSSVPPDKRSPGAPAAAVMARIAKGLAAAGTTNFVVTGNDTASAVINGLGIRNLTTKAAFGPLRWLQSKNLSICLKPGGVGGRNLFLHEFEPQIRLNEAVNC